MRSIAQLAALLFAATLPVAAQAPATTAPAGMMGAGIGGGTSGIAGQLYLGVTTPIGDFFGRGVYMTEVHGFSVGFDRQAPVDESSADIAVLYGLRVRAGPNSWLRLALGPASVRTIVEDCPSLGSCQQWKKQTTTGLALQLDVFQTRVESTLGIGLSAFGNLNSDRSFWGGTLSLHTVDLI